MCEIYMQNRSYPLFDGYELNTSKAIARYDKQNDKPLKCRIRTKEMKNCECGGFLVSLAYRYDDGVEQSRVLLGKKCICCGENYFTEKTISMFPLGFDIDNTAFSNEARMIKTIEVKRGDVFYADLKGIESWCGSEQTGYRPVLIIQNNKANEYAHTTIIAIITSKIKNYIPTHVKLPIKILPRQSFVCMEQIKTIDKSRLGNYVGNIFELDPKIEKKINKAIRESLELL